MAEMTEQTAPAVYGAIAKVQQSIATSGVAKNQQNTQQRFRFRGIDDIQNALAPLLPKAGLVITPNVVSREVSERETRSGATMFSVVLEVEYHLVAVFDGSSVVVRVIGEAMDSGDKATNKALSAAYKYMALQSFCIPTEGDNDADASTPPETFRRPASKAPGGPAQNLVREALLPAMEEFEVSEVEMGNFCQTRFGCTARTLGQRAGRQGQEGEKARASIREAVRWCQNGHPPVEQWQDPGPDGAQQAA